LLGFPSDFHLFLQLKNFLGGKRQAAAFYEEGTQKLVPRYDKCPNNGGEYVEN
jgi:hypothetical protein